MPAAGAAATLDVTWSRRSRVLLEKREETCTHTQQAVSYQTVRVALNGACPC